jgi:hypothetical protein
MKISRTVMKGVISGVMTAALSAVLIGCRDSSPLRSTAPQVPIRASAAIATASSTEFEGFINFCHQADLVFTTRSPETLHFKVANVNKWTTGNPLIDGIEHNTGSAKINPQGQVVVTLKNSLKPDAVNGTWEMIQQLRIGDAVSTGVGHGTGDLQGMTIKFTTNPEFISTSECNPDLAHAGVHGVILSPAH